jgi:alpha-1,2-mannosyltransferase
MIDLDVYRDAGRLVLSGGDLYAHTDRLPFLYPPAAALLSVPLTLIGQVAAQLCWLALCVACLLAILYRLGLTGWQLSLVAAAAVYFCEPVSQTLAYGQLGIVLVALVVLDLVPGPSVIPSGWRRRRLRPADARSRVAGALPAGVLTGLATSLKLTPALFAVYLVGAGRRRPAAGIAATTFAVAALAAVVLPGASAHYWSRLVRGDTGLPGESIVYLTNQSVLGTWLRLVGLGGLQTVTGLLLAVVVGGVGVYSAARWHRRGRTAFAVTVCGVAGLLASPVSWSHHFVWVVPLGVVLLDAGLPTVTRVSGWVFVGWVTAAPFLRLPLGDAVELAYSGWQQALASFTALSGAVFLSVSLASTLIEQEHNDYSSPPPAPPVTRKRSGNPRATRHSYVGPHG